MLVHDYECRNCGNIFEYYIADSNNIPDITPCPVCNNGAYLVFLKAGTPITDAPWIRSVTEVVDKDPSKRHCQEFLKNPTRDNYKIWIRKEGFRHIEAGEKPGRPEQKSITTEMLMEHRQKKRALCLHR